MKSFESHNENTFNHNTSIDWYNSIGFSQNIFQMDTFKYSENKCDYIDLICNNSTKLYPISHSLNLLLTDSNADLLSKSERSKGVFYYTYHMNNLAQTISDAFKDHSHNIKFGSNSKIYFQSSTSKIFQGNQYVQVTPLNHYPNSISKELSVFGYFLGGIKIYQGIRKDEGYGFYAQKATAEVVVGKIGAKVGAKALPATVNYGIKALSAKKILAMGAAGAKKGAVVGGVIGLKGAGVCAVPGAIIGGIVGGAIGITVGTFAIVKAHRRKRKSS